jgi:uncharacterized protein
VRDLSAAEELLVAVVMLVGLVGVVVPVLPGLALIWLAAAGWAWADGGGAARWSVVVVVTALLVAGTVAKYAVPARSATGAGAPRSTLLAGALGALVGFFVIPVVGLVVGGLAGIFVAELARLSDGRAALRSTRAVLVGLGIGALIELAAGLAMVWVWVLGAVLI